MKIVNLTPHNVRILTGNDIFPGKMNVYADFPSHGVARCRVESEHIDSFSCCFDGEVGNNASPMVGCIPIRRIGYGEVEGLPEPETGVYYIVSRLVKQAVPDRTDCLVPDDMIRDEEGKILGCTGFAL